QARQIASMCVRVQPSSLRCELVSTAPGVFSRSAAVGFATIAGLLADPGVGKLPEHDLVPLFGLAPVGSVQPPRGRDVRVAHEPSDGAVVGTGGDDQERGERATEVVRDEIDAELLLDRLERPAHVAVVLRLAVRCGDHWVNWPCPRRGEPVFYEPA